MTSLVILKNKTKQKALWDHSHWTLRKNKGSLDFNKLLKPYLVSQNYMCHCVQCSFRDPQLSHLARNSRNLMSHKLSEYKLFLVIIVSIMLSDQRRVWQLVVVPPALTIYSSKNVNSYSTGLHSFVTQMWTRIDKRYLHDQPRSPPPSRWSHTYKTCFRFLNWESSKVCFLCSSSPPHTHAYL